MSHPRILIVAEPNSAGTVIERHGPLVPTGGRDGPVPKGNAARLTNLVGEVMVGAGARVRALRLQQEAPTATHISTLLAKVDAAGTFEAYALTAGAGLARSEVRVTLAGAGAEARVNGVCLLRGRQHGDHTTVITHQAPHGTSRQVFKTVVDDCASAVYQGRIVVAPGAQKSDGYQSSRALLLSEHAEADTKPELEIHADDVKCSHGATVGALDEDALFYLRARGIDRASAQRLLIQAFIADAFRDLDGSFGDSGKNADADTQEDGSERATGLLAAALAWLAEGPPNVGGV